MPEATEPRRNFTRIPNEILTSQELTAQEKLTFICLAYHGYNAESCYPSIQTLADETRLSKPTIKRAIKTLSDKEYLEIIHRYKKNEPLSNAYNLCYKQEKAQKKLVPDSAKPETSAHVQKTSSETDYKSSTKTSQAKPQEETKPRTTRKAKRTSLNTETERKRTKQEWEEIDTGLTVASIKQNNQE